MTALTFSRRLYVSASCLCNFASTLALWSSAVSCVILCLASVSCSSSGRVSTKPVASGSLGGTSSTPDRFSSWLSGGSY